MNTNALTEGLTVAFLGYGDEVTGDYEPGDLLTVVEVYGPDSEWHGGARVLRDGDAAPDFVWAVEVAPACGGCGTSDAPNLHDLAELTDDTGLRCCGCFADLFGVLCEDEEAAVLAELATVARLSRRARAEGDDSALRSLSSYTASLLAMPGLRCVCGCQPTHADSTGGRRELRCDSCALI